MNEPENYDDRLIVKNEIIEYIESQIDSERKVYLITWSPDPKELPDCDFDMQHRYNLRILADYLVYCKCGLWCVETSQIGNPHYHGWYQTYDDQRERQRIIVIKTLRRFGEIRIAKCLTYRINSYSEKSNGLYYYKKDLNGQMLWIDDNPITKDTSSFMDWNSYRLASFLSPSIKQKFDFVDKISQREYYRKFYNDSLDN